MVAAIISLWNSHLIANGHGPVGVVNPLVYKVRTVAECVRFRDEKKGKRVGQRALTQADNDRKKRGAVRGI